MGEGYGTMPPTYITAGVISKATKLINRLADFQHAFTKYLYLLEGLCFLIDQITNQLSLTSNDKEVSLFGKHTLIVLLLLPFSVSVCS